jgi:pimeloyl-ACP methyl ester carboxylesterase
MESATPARARVNGIELVYQIVGAGDPLVLLHGGFGSVEMFGPNVERLAAGRQVVGVDLASHGRSPLADRPMTFEAMGDDVAALIEHLGHRQADVMGYSLGGGVALRAAIQHPESVRRLVLVSAPHRRGAWLPETVAAFDSMGPELAEPLRQTPLYDSYRAIAPRVEDWPVLVAQETTLLKRDYDWSEEVRSLSMPVLIVTGDADGVPPATAAEFFALLGGGLREPGWDGSGMTHHALAILPRTSHYDIPTSPALAEMVAAFLDRAP